MTTGHTHTPTHADIAIVGAGAAGLMAAIAAGRAARHPHQPHDSPHPPTIVALDSSRKLGTKILVAGGGRCNVTHHQVTEHAYHGNAHAPVHNAVRNVLKRFTVQHTIDFFADLGVHLKQEDTGKLFPTTDDAHTVLDALLRAAHDANVALLHPARVDAVHRPAPDHPFTLTGSFGSLTCHTLILATGGKALPTSGSDGHGYTLAASLGHSLTDHTFPALVPLVLDPASPLRALKGLAAHATLDVRAATGKRLVSLTNDTLCTHFGLSGPGPMDISRHLAHARLTDPNASLHINWLPHLPRADAEQQLLALGKRTVARWLADLLPARLAEALCDHAGLDPATTGADLRKDQRRALLDAVFDMHAPVTGDRGYTYAEVTAGGVPLAEVDIKSMHSRRCPGLHLCGEILDVDGRIGGFNFQWAWATGHLAGTHAAHALAPTPQATQPATAHTTDPNAHTPHAARR